MDVTKFKNNFSDNLLKRIMKNKKMFVLVHFNADLMHYDEHKPTNEFQDSLVSNSYLGIISKFRFAFGQIYLLLKQI